MANPQERIVRPETLQIKARLEVKLGRENEAEQDYRDAIALAVEIGAMAFELSISVDLARLLQSQDRVEEALATLERVLDRCAPDVDTPALADAQSLREELVVDSN